MELKDFVSQTLVAIHDGVADAIHQMNAPGRSGGINVVKKSDDGNVDWGSYKETIEFDIAVSSSEESTSGGNKTINVVDLASEKKTNKHSQGSTATNRVRFTVPVNLPAQVLE